MHLDSDNQKRLRRLPPVRRARGYYLYDGTGKRYLDLWQEGGRAWLGHRPDGLGLHLKNAVSRGVYAALPSAEEGKLMKALKALGKELGAESHSEIRCLPAHCSKEDGQEILLWRPGQSWPSHGDAVEPLIPLPGLDYGQILFCRPSSKWCKLRSRIPSPVLAAALTRVIWSLLAALKEPRKYEIFDSDLWKQDGAYLFWRGDESEYGSLFNRALEKKVLLSPSVHDPVILPREQSEGDRSLIRVLFRRKI